jgi:penicillin-binding protein 1A
LLEYDQRHGWRGIESTLPGPDREAWLAALAEIEPIGLLEPAVVSAVTDQRIDVIRRNGEAVRIPPSGFNWARTYRSVNSLGPEIRDARTLVSAGDLVRITQLRGDWVLAQQPAVEAGMVALDPDTGAIRAMVGGFNYFDSKFNRATQGGRQVGSGFKPLIYTAALEAGMTPASLINDAPVVFDQTEGATDWRPQNSGGDFLGPTRLRTALYRSRNLVSVRLARELGLDRILQIAERVGLPSDALPRNLSLSLGTASLTPLQMAETYAIYANGGYRVGHHLIDRIESATGEVLYQTKPVTVCRTDCAGRPVSMDPNLDNRLRPATSTLIDLDLGGSIAPRVLDARIHFLMDDMLRDVIQVGTGKRANSLGRKDIAGKTGTTNDQIDAWFNGYHASVVASVWVGFDQPKTLGRSEYGGRAALPIWIEFMETALAGQPERPRTPPPGIISARINADTGVLAGSNDGNAIREYFLADNPPPSQGSDGGVPIISGQEGERTITSPQQLF